MKYDTQLNHLINENTKHLSHLQAHIAAGNLDDAKTSALKLRHDSNALFNHIGYLIDNGGEEGDQQPWEEVNR